MRSSFAYLLLLAILLTPALPAGAAPQATDLPPFSGLPQQQSLRPAPNLATRGFQQNYLSPETRAAQPFTHLLVRRDATVPAGAQLQLFLRASADGVSWSDWGELAENDDLWTTSDGLDVQWSEVVPVGTLAQYWQVRGELTAAPDGSQPTIHQIDVNTVDTRTSPAQEQAQQAALRQARGAQTRGADKPRVVSRSAWGSPDGQGSRAAVARYDVNHLIVHHTADQGSLYPSEADWSARMRATWSFHTITRGWGDIGYNYIIAPNGLIYEGRAGGDDAVAFHDTANYGSMGVSVIGTYEKSAPTLESQDSLVALLAWKAKQKDIDPLASSYYYGCAMSKYCAPKTGTSIIPNIAGHRQVTPGHTSCPGDAFMALMPQIRYRVAQAIASAPDPQPDNGDLQVDEFETSFSKTPADISRWRNAACGAGGNTFYTFATSGVVENSAVWKTRIPKTGRYRVLASLPQNCGLRAAPYATSGARYTVSGAPGPLVVDQNAALAWVDLGVYEYAEGSDATVRLDDFTGEAYSPTAGKVIFFDAVKWVPEQTSSTDLQLTSVVYDDGTNDGQTMVPSGGLLKVSFTVKNTGQAQVYSQEPQASRTANGAAFNDGGLDFAGDAPRPEDSYAYDEGECFIGDTRGSYGAFPKEASRVRVALGPTSLADLALDCAGQVGNAADGYYPWRWGLNGPLGPGEQRTVSGYVRFRNSGQSNRVVELQPGLVQEYVRYFPHSLAGHTVIVTPERQPPLLATFAPDSLQPLARVYSLGSVPDNLLARTANPLSILKGDYRGSFVWSGAFTNWGNKGPTGLENGAVEDNFLIEQTRAFRAPESGTYTFRTTSDDGAWLWVDGREVVSSGGLHDFDEPATGTIDLIGGQLYAIAFKYFERSGTAAAGYEFALPGSQIFQVVPDSSTGGALALGNVFVENPRIALAASDLGGSGVAQVRYTLNGVQQSVSGTLAPVLDGGRLQNGSYTLSYDAVDLLGNTVDTQSISFTVDTNRTVYRAYLPLGMRP
ncbi:MAG: N-acetylmuramoyl-L-alanine amidase [Roseiflexaceae bacterium]|nr:N-acetylmuramoyl-L-alanine amidase [Roseiflexaceae bacterium]